MGMYDSVTFKCGCGDYIEYQSKSGMCSLSNYSPDSVPVEIANDIDGEIEECSCGQKYKIITPYKITRVCMMVKRCV